MLEIYGKSYCDWCTKAVELANSYNLNHTYYNCDDNVNALLLRERFPEIKTLPQIWWNGKHIVVIKHLLKKFKIQSSIMDKGLSNG